MATTISTSTNLVVVKDLASASSRAKTKYTELKSAIGTLSNLTTTDKSSLVAAINELKGLLS